MLAVYLEPRSGFVSELRSDTLFGTLAWAIRTLEGETKLHRLLAGFGSGEPPFLLSSAMPWTRDDEGKRRHFFPKPEHLVPAKTPSTQEEYTAFKAWKKTRWLDEDTFVQRLRRPRYALHEVAQDHKAPSAVTEVVMHNTLDRLRWSTGEEGRLFYKRETFYPQASGLYFLVDFRTVETEHVVLAALRLLEHIGFGGDTSTGKGQAKVELTPWEPPWPTVSEPTHFLTLSLYHPAPGERQHLADPTTRAWYKLVWRRGKVGGRFFPTPHFWKQALTFFAEGSVLPWVEEPPFGDAPVVKDMGRYSQSQFHVRAYGYGFPVPIQMQETQA